jgi:hypothetical protein
LPEIFLAIHHLSEHEAQFVLFLALREIVFMATVIMASSTGCDIDMDMDLMMALCFTFWNSEFDYQNLIIKF